MREGVELVEQAYLHGLPAETREKLFEFARAAGQGGLAAKTIAALKSDGRLFAAWCGTRGLSWLPAAPRTIADFVAAMAAAGRAPATVQRYLASIALWHAAAELANPCAHLLVKMARKAHLRAAGKRQKQAAPLGAAELATLDAVLEEGRAADDPLERLKALRDRALLLVAHDTLARAAELVSLRWEDFSIDAEGDGRILIRRSKTDQEGEGRVRWLDRTTVAALQAWRHAHDAELARRAAAEADRVAELQARRFPRFRWAQGRKRLNPVKDPVALVWLESLYLFRGLGPTGWSQRLAPGSVSRLLKQRLWQAGIEPSGYSAHSTRVGKLQDLLADGVDLLGAMNAGGWKSPAMPARYGENILAGRGAVAQQAKKKREKAESNPADVAAAELDGRDVLADTSREVDEPQGPSGRPESVEMMPPHLPAEARDALRSLHEVVAGERRRDPDRRLGSALFLLDEVADASIAADAYGFRNGLKTLIRYIVDPRYRRMAVDDIAADMAFLAAIGPAGAYLPHPSEDPDALDVRRRRGLHTLERIFPPSARRVPQD